MDSALSISKYWFLIAGLTIVPPHAAAVTLCQPTERVVFSCDFENKKAVGICVGGAGEAEYVEYRFGRAKKLEMSYRADDGSSRMFHRAEVLYASNSSRIIWFRNGEFFYRINMPMRGSPFLDVLRGGNAVAQLSCKKGWAEMRGDPELKSKFIADHGSANVSELSPLWGEK
jgi:hypothetical protein